ncbi:unnamed protein product [Arabis nemorensis]|uniref:GCK domain-containing protein n=1 Tax=Arabis nemorensis TaxID=586526 RepID=A0A565BFN5_9BRAS|nr:unnamed protein product [Arabis nemorensis]
MRGGPCKELYKVMGDCTEENGFGSKKCGEHALKVFDCMCSHPDYHHRMLAVMKSIEEHVVKEHGAYVARKQVVPECFEYQ